MANFSQGFMDDLGPLGAIWAGRDQANQENTSALNQQMGLENLLTAQQKRQFETEDRPFALDKLRHEQALRPLDLEKKTTENASAKQKFNVQQFDGFMQELPVLVQTFQGTPADGALFGELAKKHGLDPMDPRLQQMGNVATSGNKAAFEDMMKKIALSMPKQQQEMELTRFKESQATGRTALHEEGANVRNAADNARALEVAKMNNDRMTKIAEAKSAQADQLAKAKNFEAAQTAYMVAAEAAAAAGDTEAVNRNTAAAQRMKDELVNKLKLQAQAAKEGSPTVTPEGNLGTRQPTAVTPVATPSARNVAKDQPAAAPAKVTDKAGYDALPSGALYIDPRDGKTYTKP